MPSLTLEIDPKTPLHRRILDGCRDRISASRQSYQNRHKKWRDAEDRTVAYLPEKEVDAKRRNERELAGNPQYTTIQIPYSYAVLMASHTYWTTVFLARTPPLQFTGRHGEPAQSVQALEAIMDYQTTVGNFIVPWHIWFYDVGKYGVGIIGIYWDEQFSTVSEIVEKEEMFLGIIPTGNTTRKKISRRVRGYEGNTIYNIRPFDFFPDPRVTMGNYQQGEFCGVYRRLGWNTILKRADLGYYVNIDRVRPGNEPSDGQRTEGSPRVDLPDNDVFFFDINNSKNKPTESAVVPVYEVYIELIPADWGLGKGELPEKWVFTVDSWFRTVIGAQPLGQNHDKFPFMLQILEPEGYSILPRGMPEILEPVQNTMDWLINSHFYNVRKILNGQYVVDPSRIAISDMLDPVPGGIIRAKEAGYGQDMKAAIHQLQATDVTQNHIRDLQVMQAIGERAVGVNDSIMGALNSGGRKTATEVRSANTFGISRLKTIAEFFSASAWSPMSMMLVQNTQQFYTAEKMFRIAGDLMGQVGPQFVNVTQENILGFYDYVPVDGTLPIDRFAQANLWREMFMGLRQMPEIAATYDLPKMFAWIAQLAGMKNINQFKIQVMPDAALAAQAQQGNTIPLTGAGVGGVSSNLQGPASSEAVTQQLSSAGEPRQLSGAGQTT